MKTKQLVITAMLLAIATVLSVIRVFELPFGGTVTAASMMPIVLIAYIYGTRWGLLSAFVYSILQMLTGMHVVSAFFLPGESQMAVGRAILVCLIDYVLAFTVLGFAGVFKGKLKNDIAALILGGIFVCLLRYIMHIISGAVFFGSWAEWFFADGTGLSQIGVFKGFCNWVMTNVSGRGLSILYSAVYNGAYMIPETIITVLSAPFIYKALKKSGTIV